MMTNLLFNQLTAIGKRFAMVLTMLLIVGIGQAWGADVTFTANQDKGSTTNTKADSMTKSGVTISSTSAGLAYEEYRFYNGTITISSTVGNITKIVFTCTTEAYATVLEESTASTGSLSINSTTVTWTGSSSSFTIKNTAQTRVSKIVVTTASGGSATVDPTVTFSNGEYTVGGAALDLSTLLTTNSTGAVTYSVKTDGGTGATIEGSIFTATAAGQCTVQASQAATATHNTATATATITVSAPAGGGGDGECTWELVTDASTLKVDDQIVIAASDANYALGTTQNNNNRSATAITKNNDNTITIDDKVQIITLCDGLQDYTLGFSVGSAGFLYAASSSGNQLKSKGIRDNNCDWVISITNRIATIQAQGNNTRNIIRYNPNTNNGSPIFACYASSSTTGSLPAIYKKVCTKEPTVYLIPKCGDDGGGTWLVVIEWFATF